MKFAVTCKDRDATALSQAIIPMQRLRKIKFVEWNPRDARELLIEPTPEHEAELRALFASPDYEVREV